MYCIETRAIHSTPKETIHFVFGPVLKMYGGWDPNPGGGGVLPLMPLFVFVPLLAQEPSNLGPKEAELPLRLTYHHSITIRVLYYSMD